MITIDRLKYFVEVATREHVGQAAKALAISPSVVSSAITTLEAEFEHELFKRENNRLKLNENGKVLLEKAKKLLEDTNDLYHCFSTDIKKLRGHFKLAASHFLMTEYLIPAFLKIQKENPELTVEFISLDTGVAISQLLAGQVDAALVFRSSYYHELQESILYAGHFEVAVRKNHPVQRLPKKLVVKQLNELPAITFRTSYGPNFWENHPLFKAAGLIPKHTYFYEDTQSAIQLMTKTDGWAFVPDILVKKSKAIVALEVFHDASAPVNISLIQSKNRPASVFMQNLTEQLKNFF